MMHDGLNQNKLLVGLPETESSFLTPLLGGTKLELGQILVEAGKTFEHAYFPCSAMASARIPLGESTYRQPEIGLVGREGFVGLPLLVGAVTSPHRFIVQGGGTAFRVGHDYLVEALRSCPEFSARLELYSHKAAIQTSHIAACNASHSVMQRLARWLLMAMNRVGDRLTLTQDQAADILATRRSTISTVAARLQTSGAISYRRGKISIIDSKALQKHSCGCSMRMEQQEARLDFETKGSPKHKAPP
jgi:CRP-like cAMP-binding protein